jgi:hypothetical protein
VAYSDVMSGTGLQVCHSVKNVIENLKETYFEHVQKCGLASIIKAEEEEFGMFVEQSK